MTQPDSLNAPTRRALLRSALAAGALLAPPLAAFAAAPPGFDQWRDGFRARALAKGISEATWNRVMGRIEPDMSLVEMHKSAYMPMIDTAEIVGKRYDISRERCDEYALRSQQRTAAAQAAAERAAAIGSTLEERYARWAELEERASGVGVRRSSRSAPRTSTSPPR